MKKTVELRDAKAMLSALVEAAERGEATVIMRCGKPVAIIAPVEEAKRLPEQDKPSFAELLMAYPGGLELERIRSPARDVDL